MLLKDQQALTGRHVLFTGAMRACALLQVLGMRWHYLQQSLSRRSRPQVPSGHLSNTIRQAGCQQISRRERLPAKAIQCHQWQLLFCAGRSL